MKIRLSPNIKPQAENSENSIINLAYSIVFYTGV